jgi:hypothetical protein
MVSCSWLILRSQPSEDLSARFEPRQARRAGCGRRPRAAALRRGRTFTTTSPGGSVATDGMTGAGLLDQPAVSLTAAGMGWLTGPLAGPTDCGLANGPRPRMSRLTERRQHLAGVAGAKLCEVLRQRLGGSIGRAGRCG